MKAALLAALFWGQQAPPPEPEEGVRVREIGLGFRPRVEPPNQPAPAQGAARRRTIGRTDTWMPLHVTLENLGPALEGTLVARPVLGGSVEVVYTKRVTLAERALKRVSFPALHSPVQPLEVSFEDDRRGGVRLHGARAVEVPPPHSLATTTALVLVATAGRGNFAPFLARAGQGAFTQDRYVVPVDPRELPDNAIEYGGVDVVALDDLPARPSEAQQEALRQFVARGGVLVVSLLRHADRLAGSSLEGLLPAVPKGVENLREVAALGAAAGVACVLGEPQALMTFAPREGAVAWDRAAPVAVHRAYDRGVVVVLGFPLSAPFLETWPGAMRLMDALTDCRERPILTMPGQVQVLSLRKDIARALKESMVRTLPPFDTILTLMVAYGGVVLLVPYLVFRRIRRLEWSWGAILALAAVGSGVVYGVGQGYLRRESTAFRVGLIEGGSAAGPHLRHNFWSVFTAQGDLLDLAFEEPSAVPYALGVELNLRGKGPRADVHISYDEFRLRDLRTYTQDSTLFETTDVQPLVGGIRASLEGGAVRIRKDAAFPVYRAWVVHGEYAAAVPAPSALDATLPLPAAQVESVFEPLPAAPGGKERLLFDRAARVLLEQASQESRRRQRPILIYQYDGAPSLKNKALSEFGLDFGWLEIEDAPPSAARAQWSLRRLTPFVGQGGYDMPLLSSEGVEYVMVLDRLPSGFRPVDLRFAQVPGGNVRTEVCDVRLGRWHAVRSGNDLDVDRFVVPSPLGPAYARLRIRVPQELTPSNVAVTAEISERSFVATSGLERARP